MKKGPVGTKLFHVDGQTDMTKLIVDFFFRNFSKAPKKYRSRSGGLQTSQQSKNRRNTASRSGDRVT